jgi:uncharacterized protein involved in response to NO
MTTTAERYRAFQGAPLFSMGFRPFFLFAAAWAALAVPIWMAGYFGWMPYFTRDWHVHEMLFGYLSAVIAGFLLTAVPNWTGRLPVTGAPLIMLFGLWAAGRLTMLAAPESAIASVVDSAFLFALALTIAREVFAGRNLRNLPVCVLILVLASANALTHLRGAEPELATYGERIGLAVVTMLITLIGGRIVPSFTRNWMAKNGVTPEPAPASRFDVAALILTAAVLVLWVASPNSTVCAAGLMLAGTMNFVRLARWRGWTTASEPLVLILHLGYAWLSAALLLIGVASVAPQIVSSAAGLHALTAGAFGVMTLAVMTRATLGHTGRPLIADRSTQAIYLLVNLGAVIRVASPFLPQHYATLLIVAALAWSGAFALFVVAYAPSLLRARRTA